MDTPCALPNAWRQTERVEGYVNMLACIFIPLIHGLGGLSNVAYYLGVSFDPGLHPAAFLWSTVVTVVHVMVPSSPLCASRCFRPVEAHAVEAPPLQWFMHTYRSCCSTAVNEP